MSQPTARELLDEILRSGGGMAGSLDMKAYSLAARVERVLNFCEESFSFWKTDLEHSDPVVRALARGRVSAAEQVVRLLNGEDATS